MQWGIVSHQWDLQQHQQKQKKWEFVFVYGLIKLSHLNDIETQRWIRIQISSVFIVWNETWINNCKNKKLKKEEKRGRRRRRNPSLYTH